MLRRRLSFYSLITEIVFIYIHFSNKRLYKTATYYLIPNNVHGVCHTKLPPIIWYQIMCMGFATWLFKVDQRYIFLDLGWKFELLIHFLCKQPTLCLLFTIIFMISSLSFQKLPRGCDKPVETSNFSLFVQACLQIGRTWWKPLRNPAFLPILWPITVTAYLENAAFGRKSFTDQICQWRSGDFEIQWTQFSSLFFHWWDLSCGV